MVRVEVAFGAAPRQVQRVMLELPAGATVADALAASGLLPDPAGAAGTLACGVWGRRCEPTRRLVDGDRVELYRPLTVDPKEARRLRYQGQRQAKRPARAGRL